MTLPVPNQQSPIAEIRKDNSGRLLAYLIPPWNSWFQQFSQAAPTAIDVTSNSPFTANSNGTLFIRNAFVSDPTNLSTFIRLTRGTTKVYIPGTNAIIPIAIKDTVIWANIFPIPPLPVNQTVVQFLGA